MAQDSALPAGPASGGVVVEGVTSGLSRIVRHLFLRSDAA